MLTSPATLHLLCGKIASGKSTLSKKLAQEQSTVLLSEDDWLGKLYPDEIKTVQDYVRCTAHLRSAIEGHVIALLEIGVSVVLDFPANTVANRKWMKSMLGRTQAEHRLHFLDVPDDVCLARLQSRNAAGEHHFSVSDADFHHITSYFVPPQEEEGFNIIRYRE